MLRMFLLIVCFGVMVPACGILNVPAPTATVVLSPTPAPAEIVPALIKEIDLKTQTGTAYTLDWSPDGETLAVASGFEITLVRADLSEVQVVLKPEGGGLAVTWHPDQTKLATVNGFRNPTLKIWNWSSGDNQLRPAQEIQAGSDQYGVFWSPDGKLLATLADDDKSTFQIWDTSTWEEIHKYELSYANPLRTLSWSADSSRLYAAGASSGQVFVYALNVTDGGVEQIAKFPLSQAAVFAFSPDPTNLAIADAHGVVQIHDLDSGEILAEFNAVDQPVDLGWSPNGDKVAILGYKTELQLWDVGS